MEYEGDKPDARKYDVNARVMNVRLAETPSWMEQINPIENRLIKIGVTSEEIESRDIHERYHAVILETYELCFDIMVEDTYKKYPDLNKMAVPLYAHTILADSISEGRFWDVVKEFLDSIDDEAFKNIFLSEN